VISAAKADDDGFVKSVSEKPLPGTMKGYFKI